MLIHAQPWIEKKFDVQSILNVTYGTATNFNGGTDTLKMDIYSPICSETVEGSPRPLLMCIHGGAFLAGDKSENSITNLCKQFASRGYVTVSINYRLGFIADDAAWNCNYPNYSCVFAADSSEWYRSYFRAIQDGKGALRYLINRNATLLIDTSNIFVAGESAGAFIALGIALMDTITEKPSQAYTIGDASIPNLNSLSCIYNVGKTYPAPTISRFDLGNIEGNIEPTRINFTIKGIGNMYGGMVNDLLKYQRGYKPAIYSFHQPCDLVVPIDSGAVYQGLSWCMTNGYNCYGISNTPKVFGSRTISNWNDKYQYGFSIHNEFTSTNFPFSFIFGTGSCVDQVNNPCHAYDNVALRENNLADFFAPLITSTLNCETSTYIDDTSPDDAIRKINIYPNPAHNLLNVDCENYKDIHIEISYIYGIPHISDFVLHEKFTSLDIRDLPQGLYLMRVYFKNAPLTTKIISKH